jgi:deoxyribodipyrimidine photolyase
MLYPQIGPCAIVTKTGQLENEIDEHHSVLTTFWEVIEQRVVQKEKSLYRTRIEGLEERKDMLRVEQQEGILTQQYSFYY